MAAARGPRHSFAPPPFAGQRHRLRGALFGLRASAAVPSHTIAPLRFVLPLGGLGGRCDKRRLGVCCRPMVVPAGWVATMPFSLLRAAQAVPGPCSTFAAYLGNGQEPRPQLLVGGLICLSRSSYPSFLLLMGRCRVWDSLRRPAGNPALRGVTLRWWACFSQRFTHRMESAILRPQILRSSSCLFCCGAWAVPPWLVVILGRLSVRRGWPGSVAPQIERTHKRSFRFYPPRSCAGPSGWR